MTNEQNRTVLDGKLLEIISRLVTQPAPDPLLYQCRVTFDGVNLSGKALLEIGAGNGVMSAYAVIHGARRVVALEPETAGSTKGSISSIQQIAQRLGGEIMAIHATSLQEYQPSKEKFDIVLLHDSVNHLDEANCMKLHYDQAARERYTELFRKIVSMMRPGKLLLLSDCSRGNLYDKIGMSNPFVPQIEWQKHQSPEVWIKLLRPLGFDKMRLRWHVPYRLKRLGLLVGNRLANFFLTSHFHLMARYRP